MTTTGHCAMAWRLACAACLLASCGRVVPGPSATDASSVGLPKERLASHPIVAAARAQVGRTTTYDPAYVGLAYPGGDVPIGTGVCSDVVVRALRDACGMDLQELVHEDMVAVFRAYPALWGLAKPDRNIDHRRVPNLECFFHRKGYAVRVGQRHGDYLPGDLVTCMVAGSRPHIMVVSDRRTPEGVPLVIHNIGNGVREEDQLFDFPTTGHYRIPLRGRAGETGHPAVP